METPLAPRWLRRGVRSVASIAGIAVLAAALQLVTGASPATAAPLAAAQTFTNPGLAPGNARFVDAAVRDLLGRPSTTADRARWVPALDAGQSQAAFASTVTRTPEWASVVVTDLYAQVFGRTPDAGGLTYWSAQLAGGTPTAFLAGLLYGSPEFFTSAGATNPGYVDALYLNILRRLPDPGGRAYWIAQLDGGSDRPALARSLFLAVESNGRRVDGMYQRLLGRAPDTGGRAYWATVLITSDDLQLAALLVGSAEYFTAAQTRFESATVTTAVGTVVLSGTQVTALAVDGNGAGSVTAVAGAPVPTAGRHVIVSRGTATGFAVGQVIAVTVRPDGTTVTTFRSAGLADALSKADVTATTELPRSGAIAVVSPAAPDGWTCTVGADSLDVSTRFTADAALDGRLLFDVVAGTYTARAVATVSTGFTANLEAAATTAGCDWSGGLWNARWSVLIPAGPITIPISTTLDGTFDLDTGFPARFSSSSSASVACRVGFTASATAPPAHQAGCDPPVASGGGSVLAPGRARALADLVVDVRLGSAHTGLAMHGTLAQSLATVTDTAARPWWWIELGVDAGGTGDVKLGRWTRSAGWPSANVLRQRLAQAPPGSVPLGPAPLSITSTTVPPGVVGRPYTATFTAAGVPPYRWSATGLPAGLTVSGAGISGAPTGVGITSVSVTVTDAAERSVTARLDVVVDPAAPRGSVISRVTSGAGEFSRSYDQVISRDGNTVAFTSDATGLVAGDTNGVSDVFTWERTSGRIVRITNGRDPSMTPTISADGRFVAYWSGPADGTLGTVYLWDRTTGTTSLVAAGNGWSGQPSISGDGRYVAFTSQATDLVPGDSNAVADIFLRDRTAATTVRLTNGNGNSSAPAISNDGRFVGYLSTATNLVAGGPADPIGTNDVFVWARASGNGRVTTGVDSLDPTISDDGRFVAFSSESGTLVAGDTNSLSDVFVADRSNATVSRIVLGVGGSEYPAISGDGRVVAFASAALNQNAYDVAEFADIFVWTRSSGTVTRLVQGNGRSIAPRMSGDGQRVVFLSAATGLAWLEFNGSADDVYLVG